MLSSFCRLFVVICSLAGLSAHGQTTTVIEATQNADQIASWARENNRVTISGRFEGRFARQFRLAGLPITMKPNRTTVLPSRLESGQRLTVSGRIQKSGTKYEMDVDRLAVGSTDAERIRNQIRRLPTEKPESGFDLADQYQPIASFYDDEDLRAELRRVRMEAFIACRDAYAGDARLLSQLAARVELLPDFAAAEVQLLRFESLVALRKQRTVGVAELLKVAKEMEGWDRPNEFLDARAEARFAASPMTEYEQSDAQARQRMHRKVYRQIRLPQVLAELKPDGSNGLDVAAVLEKELPEEVDARNGVRARYVEYRLSTTGELRRKQLEDLVRLLVELERPKEAEKAVDQWLLAQEQRLNTGRLEGTISTAESYLFAFDRWQDEKHRDLAVELLKKAWIQAESVAPDEASDLLTTLKRYGWERLQDRWMTSEDVANLPRNDFGLAMREHRVVVGMKRSQVLKTQGAPDRTIRIASSTSIQEIWIFQDLGTDLIVHMTRGRFDDAASARATFVGTQSR